MTVEPTQLAGETAELLTALIRNACVNDGRPESGQEARNAETLRAYLGPAAAVSETYEPVAGRRSLLARLEGSDPGAPGLLLMGHTDVVPVSPDGWSRDPFAGEVVDGELWGRGAVDMLNLTASMAVAFRRLAASGFTPRAPLAFLAVADEEAMGTHGASWLTRHAAPEVGLPYVVTESGGVPIPTAAGTRLTVAVAEKGTQWTRLVVHGSPGHGSRPLGSDNALVTAAEVVRRVAAYRPEARITETWRRFVAGLGFPAEVAEVLADPERVGAGCESGLAGEWAPTAQACTHMTFAPTVVHGGTKTNVIPDRVTLEVDIRVLPGEDRRDVEAHLAELLAELAPRVEVEVLCSDTATESPLDTPLWASLQRVSQVFHPGSALLPMMTTGATDARFFRGLGSTCYGFGLFSNRMSLAQFSAMFHGNDERVDVESLGLSAAMWEELARDLVG